MAEIIVTRQDHGKIIEATRDDIIVVRLDENPATGYRWEAEASASPVAGLISSDYSDAPGTALGRGGTRIIRFVAESPGSGEIRLSLRRSWDPPDKALDRLVVTIRVRSAPGD